MNKKLTYTLTEFQIEDIDGEIDGIRYKIGLDRYIEITRIPKYYQSYTVEDLISFNKFSKKLQNILWDIPCNNNKLDTSYNQLYSLCNKYYGSPEWELLGSRVYNLLYKWMVKNGFKG